MSAYSDGIGTFAGAAVGGDSPPTKTWLAEAHCFVLIASHSSRYYRALIIRRCALRRYEPTSEVELTSSQSDPRAQFPTKRAVRARPQR